MIMSTNSPPVLDPPPLTVMKSGDSEVWARAFLDAIAPVKLDPQLVELWMRAALGTGFVMGQRKRA
jgi:hypothetical protein